MFWESFSWDYNKLCHCWKKKTAKEKKDPTKKIAKIYQEIEPICCSY